MDFNSVFMVNGRILLLMIDFLAFQTTRSHLQRSECFFFVKILKYDLNIKLELILDSVYFSLAKKSYLVHLLMKNIAQMQIDYFCVCFC